MPPSQTVNRRIVLNSRPRGVPSPENFRLEAAPVPPLGNDGILLRTVYLSLDPYMRQLMNEVGPIYAPSVPLGGVMPGGTVSRVIAATSSQYRPGELVLANGGWQEFSVSDGKDLVPLRDLEQPSRALGILGMPGFTAYVGLLDVGRPKSGETVVVSAATGAVGAVVGQIAKLKGAHVVGIAGGPDKCRYATEELGFDICVDRRAPELAAKLAAACPRGIDVYFENVGGAVFQAVVPLLNIGARVPVCGVIAHYNEDDAASSGPDHLPQLMRTMVQKRIRLQGFVILDHYAERYPEFLREMSGWLADGKMKYREDVIDGLENVPAAFIGLLQGGNFGKLVARLAAA